jgi:hypothetical protein
VRSLRRRTRSSVLGSVALSLASRNPRDPESGLEG